jgi:creatine kinase/arginine kinase
MSQSTYPVFSDQCTSLLKKHLTPAIWHELAELRTESGYRFSQLIRSGIEQQDSDIGVYAGDAESYALFAPLLTPIIEDYHGSTGNHPAPDFSFDDLPEINEAAQQRIISTRVRVGRNLAGFPLGPGINKAQRLEVEALIKQALAELPESIQGDYLPLSGMDEALRKDLIARHLLFKSEDRFLTSASLMRDWPEGRGLFLSKDEAFSVWVNEEDQLRIIALKQGSDVTTVFKLLADGVKSLSKHLDFSFNARIGNLTSCPTNLGTAMRASVHMKLSTFSKDETALYQQADALGLQVRGIDGEHSQSKGGIYDISNRLRMGVTEKTAILHLVNGINALAEMDS